MVKLKSILGYSWAVLAVIIALATFLGEHAFSRVLASATGVTVSAKFSGGEVIRSVNHGSYRTDIHRPVFDALIGQSKEGFIQVNWVPAAGLPKVIREEIDFTGEGKGDFTITLNTQTGEAELKGSHPSVVSLGKTLRLRDGWAARILLERRSP